ncbi:MAG: DUF1552 domain-containing protein [Myxococcota bacterium]
MPRTKPLDRRTMLRGLVGGTAVAIGLPALDIMLNGNGDALASGPPLPDRFGVWFWGNGVRPDYWRPTGTTGWSPSAELTPLADLVPYVSVVTGCGTKTPYWPHHSGVTAIMTGAPYYQVGTTRDTIVSTFAKQSVDMDAADWFSGQAPFRSLEVGVCRFTGTDEGTSFQHLSHNGPNNPNPSEYSPSALFARLFTAPTSPEINLVRQSVLDGVTSQLTRLKTRLGARDIERLDQHLDSVRTLEDRLAAEPATCLPGDAPQDVADIDGLEQIEEKNAAMADLMVLALSCDLTRSFAFQYSVCGGGNVFWQVGMTDGLHSQCHLEADPQPIVHAEVVFTMDRLGYFLRKLRDTADGSGNLLERCSILCTTEHYDGHSHSQNEFPILIAGLGNGRLRGNTHYRYSGADGGSYRNTSDAVLTALHGAGVTLPEYGTDAGYTTSTISELLV